MRIGILQCGPNPPEVARDHGDLAGAFRDMLAGHGFDMPAWQVHEMDFPDSVTDCDGWLITGSRYGVYEDHAFLAPLRDFVRDAREAGVPMVGICFGHQIMAQALGGRVEKFEGGWSVGRHVYDFDGAGETALNAWHQDQVLEPPADATPIASSDFCRFAGLRYGDWGYSVQAHPEFTAPVIADFTRNRRGGPVPDALLDAAAEAAAHPLDAARVSDDIAAFFRAAGAARGLARTG